MQKVLSSPLRGVLEDLQYGKFYVILVNINGDCCFVRLRGGRSYADGGPTRTAPEGLVPLDSLSPLRRGIGAVVTVSAYCFSPPKGRRAEEATTNLFFYAQYRIFLRKTIPGIRSSKGDVLTI